MPIRPLRRRCKSPTPCLMRCWLWEGRCEMRISSNTIFDSNVAALNQQQARLLQTQQQIASGRRILAASDDPVAATRALEINQADATNAQYASNRNSARNTLTTA